MSERYQPARNKVAETRQLISVPGHVRPIFLAFAYLSLDSADANVLFSFSMSQDPTEDDGQLHTLGLLEQLRKESSLAGAAFSALNSRVGKLLREIENPNLHDIANLNYRVELWDKYALHIRWTVAAVGHVYIAQVAFDEAIRQFPNERLTLRNGILVIREHQPKSAGGKDP